MEFIESNVLSDAQKLEIIVLWNNEYPESLSHESIETFNAYLRSITKAWHILLKDSNGHIQGWCLCFTRDNERWFTLIIDSSLHGKGFGTQLLEYAKAKEQQLNGWVIDHDKEKKKNGELYRSPLPFYIKNGFEIVPTERLNHKISAIKIIWGKTTS
ncbi:MAG: GNAT family N-acetyltransferase [Bacteroidota bacterium]